MCINNILYLGEGFTNIGKPLLKSHHDQDPNFDRKLDEITTGLQPFVKQHLLTRISPENARIIVDYMKAMKYERNPSVHYRAQIINTIKHLSEFHENQKSYRDMTRDDIAAFLNRHEKPESQDPPPLERVLQS